MKQLFSYKHPQGISNTAELSIGISNRFASFMVLDSISRTPRALSFFEVEDWGSNSISNFLETCVTLGSFINVQLFVSPAEQTLLPISHYEKEVLRVHHQLTNPASTDSIFLYESYADWQFYVGYSIPSSVWHAIKTRFPSCGIKHAFKPMFYDLPARHLEGTICIDVGVQQFNVLVFRRNQLLFCGTFCYVSEFDALYYLLKICRENSLLAAEVELIISGLIDSTSKLFTELTFYFKQLAFRENENDWSGVEFPVHYFTIHSNNLLCAS